MVRKTQQADDVVNAVNAVMIRVVDKLADTLTSQDVPASLVGLTSMGRVLGVQFASPAWPRWASMGASGY